MPEGRKGANLHIYFWFRLATCYLRQPVELFIEFHSRFIADL